MQLSLQFLIELISERNIEKWNENNMGSVNLCP